VCYYTFIVRSSFASHSFFRFSLCSYDRGPSFALQISVVLPCYSDSQGTASDGKHTVFPATPSSPLAAASHGRSEPDTSRIVPTRLDRLDPLQVHSGVLPHQAMDSFVLPRHYPPCSHTHLPASQVLWLSLGIFSLNDSLQFG
jgi:hypothetical protein